MRTRIEFPHSEEEQTLGARRIWRNKRGDLNAALFFLKLLAVNHELDSLEREKAEGARRLDEKRMEHLHTLHRLGRENYVCSTTCVP